MIGGGVFFLFVLAVFTLVYLALHAGGENASFRASFGDKIGVVELEGVILDPGTVVQQIKKFGDDDSIKAIIIHVNSPGGGVAASEEIYREVKRVRDEKKKHIVASIESVGASGAYYVSSATNKIYADNGSVFFSIFFISALFHSRHLLLSSYLPPSFLPLFFFYLPAFPPPPLPPSVLPSLLFRIRQLSASRASRRPSRHSRTSPPPRNRNPL